MDLFRSRLDRRHAIVALGAAVAAPMAFAQAFPSRPIKIIDAFAPGATTDIIARIVSNRMQVTFGQPVIVESRTGANGVVGSEFVARATPDGYTMFVGSTSTLAVNQALYKMSFDPTKDLAPVSMLAAQPLIVVVHPSLPIKSIPELIAYAKANPQALNYATPGIGNPVHLATELFKKMTGAPMTHVPYARGSAAAMPDLLSGQVQLMFAPMYVLPQVRDGRLRALAVTGPKRLDLVADLPTVAEAGVAGYNVTLWNAMAVPAGTPKDVVAKLNAEIVRILQLPEVRTQMLSTGLEPIPGTPEQQAAFTRSEAEQWTRLIKDIGIKVESS
ncbi:tripartite tricarboxylate transporter substrate binding protein [Variovorax sp. KK3]|uniref:Bug family tripartite tricarboxylate transporter substrate binding protein n=1 Tax=Variovorax sp. KK3 TaxID=1855728 RepID=UPI00097BDC1C|nr:tripartite tricarboxylate transporter substrate binding protein [Variovorax sp. KK3]